MMKTDFNWDPVKPSCNLQIPLINTSLTALRHHEFSAILCHKVIELWQKDCGGVAPLYFVLKTNYSFNEFRFDVAELIPPFKLTTKALKLGEDYVSTVDAMFLEFARQCCKKMDVNRHPHFVNYHVDTRSF